MLDRLKETRVVRVAMGVSQRYGQDSGSYLAASIAFYGFLSLFPILLVALAVVGFVVAENPKLREDLAGRVEAAVPGLETLIGNNLDHVVRTRAGAGAIGLVSLFWTGTGAVAAARNSLRRIFRQPVIPGFVKQKLWLVGTTAWLGAAALATMALAAVVGGVRASGPLGVVVLIIVPLATVGLDLLLFLLAYWVLLRRQHPLGSLWPGALLAAIGWTILKVAGAWYASRTLTGASAVYGTFAATVAALLLLYLAARLFIYGAELNAVLMEEGGGGRVEDTPGDRRETVPEPADRADAAARGEGDRSAPQLVSAIGTDMVDLVRKEIELAKQEVKEGVSARVQGGMALGAAGVLALFGFGFLAAAAAWALDLVLQPWASRLIVGGALLLVAVVAAIIGRSRLKSAPLGPKRTKETIKEDVEWARAQLKR